MLLSTQSSPCACGSGLAYAQCCAVAHNNHLAVKTPEQLMRSRYTAFTKGLVDYLLATHRPPTPIANLDDERVALLVSVQSRQWVGLEIIEAPTPIGSEGFVEFKAYCVEHGSNQRQCLHERSRFQRLATQKGKAWFYIDGVY